MRRRGKEFFGGRRKRNVLKRRRRIGLFSGRRRRNVSKRRRSDEAFVASTPYAERRVVGRG